MTYKYIETVPFLSKVSESIKSMADIKNGPSCHHGNSKKRTLEESQLVQRTKDIISDKKINPFACDNEDDLLNIASGEETANTDLRQAKTEGIEAIENAIKQNSSKIHSQNLCTFSTNKKSRPSRTPGLIKLYQDESAVTCALCFSRSADDEIQAQVFSHEWCDYPPSLFKVDQSFEQGYVMHKGCKSNFCQYCALNWVQIFNTHRHCQTVLVVLFYLLMQWHS